MTTQELKTAAHLALQTEEDLASHATSMFAGFGLHGFAPVFCTIKQLAWLIRYQCAYMFGEGHDTEAMAEIVKFGKKRFQII